MYATKFAMYQKKLQCKGNLVLFKPISHTKHIEQPTTNMLKVSKLAKTKALPAAALGAQSPTALLEPEAPLRF
jgi:hypothetical protein